MTILFILVIVKALCGYTGYKLYGQVISLAKQLDSSKTMKDPQAISRIISTLQQETAAAQQIVQERLWKFASRIPVHGGDVRAVQGMVDASDGLLQTMLPQLNGTAQQLVDARFSHGSGEVNIACSKVPVRIC